MGSDGDAVAHACIRVSRMATATHFTMANNPIHEHMARTNYKWRGVHTIRVYEHLHAQTDSTQLPHPSA